VVRLAARPVLSSQAPRNKSRLSRHLSLLIATISGLFCCRRSDLDSLSPQYNSTTMFTKYLCSTVFLVLTLTPGGHRPNKHRFTLAQPEVAKASTAHNLRAPLALSLRSHSRLPSSSQAFSRLIPTNNSCMPPPQDSKNQIRAQSPHFESKPMVA